MLDFRRYLEFALQFQILSCCFKKYTALPVAIHLYFLHNKFVNECRKQTNSRNRPCRKVSVHDRNVPRKHATLHASSLLAHSRSCCVVCGRRCGQPQPLWRTRARSRSHMHISLGRRLGGALSGVRAARHAARTIHGLSPDSRSAVSYTNVAYANGRQTANREQQLQVLRHGLKDVSNRLQCTFFVQSRTPRL